MTQLANTDNTTIVPAALSVGAMESALAMGDLSRLTSADRLKYVGAICQSVGLNPLTRPFDFITLQGKLTMYANKGCAEQLRASRGISCEIVERKFDNGCCIVRVKAYTKDGRCDEATGAVVIAENAKGEAFANAVMKAETKAKRRATLSLCGLGIIDESELDTVQHTAPAPGAGTDAPSAADRAAMLNTRIVADAPTVDVEPNPPAEKQVAEAWAAAAAEAQRAPTTAEKVAFANKLRKWTGLPKDEDKTACSRFAEKCGKMLGSIGDIRDMEATIAEHEAAKRTWFDVMNAPA